MSGVEGPLEIPKSTRNDAAVWTWTPIESEDELEVPGPNDSLERTVALRLLTSLPNPNTRAAYRRDVNYFMNWWQDDYAPVLLARENGDPRSPIESSRADLEQYLRYFDTLEDQLSAATINRRIAVVASFFNRAIDDDDIPVKTNPAGRLKRPSIDNDHRTGLATSEAAQLLRTARSWPDRTEGTLVMALLLLGLRISEAVTLTSDDVIRDGGYVKITPKRKGKNGRKILIVDEPELATRLEQLAENGPLVFPEVDRFAGARIIAKLGKAAALKQPLFPHLLRHTYVTELLRAGLDIETVRELAGHESIETTQRYAKAIAAETAAAAGLLAGRYADANE